MKKEEPIVLYPSTAKSLLEFFKSVNTKKQTTFVYETLVQLKIHLEDSLVKVEKLNDTLKETNESLGTDIKLNQRLDFGYQNVENFIKQKITNLERIEKFAEFLDSKVSRFSV